MELFEREEELLNSFLITRWYGCQFHAPMAWLQGKDLPVRATEGCVGPLAAALSLGYRGSNTFICGIKFT